MSQYSNLTNDGRFVFRFFSITTEGEYLVMYKLIKLWFGNLDPTLHQNFVKINKEYLEKNKLFIFVPTTQNCRKPLIKFN